MNMACVEKQLILNRLGDTSLNDDIVEIIKDFTFKSFIRMEAERKKELINTEFRDIMYRWTSTAYPQWIVKYNAYAPSHLANPSFFGGYIDKQMGASMCSSCGNYQQHFGLNPNVYNGAGHAVNGCWVSVYDSRAGKCALRARCQCEDFDELKSVVDEIHTWPPSVGYGWSDSESSDEDPFNEIWDPPH